MTALRLGLAAVGHPSHIPVILGFRPKGGLGLIYGEAQGLGIDFTDSLGNAGLGSVAVRDTATPANNLSNVPAGDFLTNSGTSPKLVRNAAGTYVWTPHNLQVQSETFDNAAWTKNNLTVEADVVTAQNGTVTADTITDDAANFNHDIQDLNTSIVGATYTQTVYAKAGTNTFISILAYWA